MISSVLSAYGIANEDCLVEPLMSGLINRTWKITSGNQQFILQSINDHVFKKPYAIAENISMLDQYLKEHRPGYLFVSPLKSIQQQDIVRDEAGGYFRLFPFIKGSHTLSVVASPEQAYEAALQFGKFARVLSDFDSCRLNVTIPDFHNLTLRYQQFDDAIKHGNAERIKQSATLIKEIKERQYILASYEKIKRNPNVKHRVMHHDTKISNVLFDDQGKGLCVIDLDTVMSGYFISDMGDMMRTYLSPANEEEKDFSKVEVRDDFFRAIVQGYLSNMGDAMTDEEKELIFYSGLFLIYMQAIRFLADYFNNDSYYGARYEDQNFVRTGNQMRLLKSLEEKHDVLQTVISKELKSKTYIVQSPT